MIRTQVSLEADMYDAARREAKRLGISFAELCRRALEQVIRPPQEGDQPWMRHAGALETDDPSASQNLDDVVYGRDPL